MKSDIKSQSFKQKFSMIFFVHNLVIGRSKKKRVKYPKKKLLNKGKKKPGLKLYPGLALFGL